jgi:hypothetical protein
MNLVSPSDRARAIFAAFHAKDVSAVATLASPLRSVIDSETGPLRSRRSSRSGFGARLHPASPADPCRLPEQHSFPPVTRDLLAWGWTARGAGQP